MLTVTSDKDRVLLSFFARGQDLCMPPDTARAFVSAVRVAVSECRSHVSSGGVRTILTGEARGAAVKSWDGNVNVRFASPTRLESIPFEDAEKLANEVESRIAEAEHRFTILWKPENQR